MKTAPTREEQIKILDDALGILNHLEYEALGFDPNSFLSALPADHPKKDWIEELICARHALHVVATTLRRG